MSYHGAKKLNPYYKNIIYQNYNESCEFEIIIKLFMYVLNL